jgi:hypothetical protein
LCKQGQVAAAGDLSFAVGQLVLATVADGNWWHGFTIEAPARYVNMCMLYSNVGW